MLKINYEQTKVLTKKHLDTLSKYFKAGYYRIKKVPLYKIDEDTNFMDLLTINCSTPYDDTLIHDLEILSRMDVLSKQILYCVHLLGIKRRNLESGNDYSFGKPYEDYKRALLGYGLSMESLIAYAD